MKVLVTISTANELFLQMVNFWVLVIAEWFWTSQVCILCIGQETNKYRPTDIFFKEGKGNHTYYFISPKDYAVMSFSDVWREY